MARTIDIRTFDYASGDGLDEMQRAYRPVWQSLNENWSPAPTVALAIVGKPRSPSTSERYPLPVPQEDDQPVNPVPVASVDILAVVDVPGHGSHPQRRPARVVSVHRTDNVLPRGIVIGQTTKKLGPFDLAKPPHGPVQHGPKKKLSGDFRARMSGDFFCYALGRRVLAGVRNGDRYDVELELPASAVADGTVALLVETGTAVSVGDPIIRCHGSVSAVESIISATGRPVLRRATNSTLRFVNSSDVTFLEQLQAVSDAATPAEHGITGPGLMVAVSDETTQSDPAIWLRDGVDVDEAKNAMVPVSLREQSYFLLPRRYVAGRKFVARVDGEDMVYLDMSLMADRYNASLAGYVLPLQQYGSEEEHIDFGDIRFMLPKVAMGATTAPKTSNADALWGMQLEL